MKTNQSNSSAASPIFLSFHFSVITIPIERSLRSNQSTVESNVFGNQTTHQMRIGGTSTLSPNDTPPLTRLNLSTVKTLCYVTRHTRLAGNNTLGITELSGMTGKNYRIASSGTSRISDTTRR